LISFGIKYGILFIPVILVTAAGIVLLLYYKNRETGELTKGQRGILMTLRFLSFGLVAVLLLSPFLRNIKKIVQQPLIIAAWDNSGSLVSAADSLHVASEVSQLREKINTALGNTYPVVHYTFGQEVIREKLPDFSAKKSDYSRLLSTLTTDHFNEHIGAVILTGDGIYNQGQNPLNMLDEFSFPVYTIGLGDTTAITDAGIQGIRVNRTTFSGNRFPVEIDTHFLKLKGSSLQLTVMEGEQVLSRDLITPPNDDYFNTQTIILEAGSPELKHFQVQLETGERERNKKNNRTEFVVNVLENKQKILILSDGPHPDIGAIKHVLDQQRSYEVSIFTHAPYPDRLNDYNLIILNQLPASGISMSGILGTPAVQRVPLLFVVGPKTYLPQLDALSAGTEIEPLTGSPEEVQAVINPAYLTFSLSEDFREILPRFPPLIVPFARYNPDPGFSTLLYQKVKNIETNKPLLVTGRKNGRKTGFLFGEGIWRWRMNNYVQNQSHQAFSELISQLVQYLALQHNEDQFMIDFKPAYAETDPVVFQAEVYNDALEKITTEEVSVVIRNEQGDEFSYTFDVRGNGYHLDAGNLPVGHYSFQAEVMLGDQSHLETGHFAVTAVHLEHIVTQANHRMLYQLASQSTGTFHTPDQVDRLIEELKKSDRLKPVNYFQEVSTEWLNLRWLFFVVLLLFSVEWFLRKFWGIY
jgi:hypothetical protein